MQTSHAEKRVPTHELQKEFYNMFLLSPPPQEGSGCFNYPKEKHNKTGKNITVYCSPQWTYGLSVLILYILRVADFIIVYAFLHIPDINFRTSSGARPRYKPLK